jgi:hypothetical protein
VVGLQPARDRRSQPPYRCRRKATVPEVTTGIRIQATLAAQSTSSTRPEKWHGDQLRPRVTGCGEAVTRHGQPIAAGVLSFHRRCRKTDQAEFARRT